MVIGWPSGLSMAERSPARSASVGTSPEFSLGDMIACPLVDEEEVWTTRQQVRDLHWTAKGKDAGDGIVGGLGRFEPAERVGARIEGGVIEDDRKTAVVETLAVGPAIAKGLVEREA